MSETAAPRQKRSLSSLLASLLPRKSSAEAVPDALARRMTRMERDLSRRLPSRGFLK